MGRGEGLMSYPPFLETRMTNPLHPTVQDAVQARIEHLYLEDGRDHADHPQHALYTGLNTADDPADE
jgi:hypothetical protein